jgi:hypothetical protein
MRWLTSGPRADDERLAETEALLVRIATRGASLSSQQRERMRATTVGAFEAQLGARVHRTPPRRAPRALAVVLAMAALFALTGTVAAAESGPGQPFYGLRLSLESLTLPSGGSARTEALLAQLDRRLDEARQESQRGNAVGVADAVQAYLATLDEIRGGIGAGVGQTSVEAGLERHINALEKLLPSAPSAAQPGLQQALEGAQQALDQRSGAHGPQNQPPHPGLPQSQRGRP